MRRSATFILFLWGIILTTTACTSPTDPEQGSIPQGIEHDGTLRIAALDYQIGDLTDPGVMAKYVRADILIAQCDQFWGRDSFEGKMALLRAANPDLKIIGYFRSKVVKANWGDTPGQTYNYDLYQASLPYWAHTTTGDTVMDWPGAAVFDFTDPAARLAMLEVFRHYQQTSTNKFDGVFWDYFNPSLWIAPAVRDMNGEPDLDGDGIGHWSDADELQAFKDGQEAWIAEMQSVMGRGFIQIANGSRAVEDSVFARRLDGMFYEIFPDVGFTGGAEFAQALDPARFNNLWTARSWPRTGNGGPWLILSNSLRVGSYRTPDGEYVAVNAGDLTRIMALLTDATSIHYDNSGEHRAGIPNVELDLGRPLGGVTITGDTYERRFERGRVSMVMGSGAYPVPFGYRVVQKDIVVEEIESPF